MPIAVLMPALSPTMKKGNLVKWYKKKGDTVSSGDVLADIETDKATMEVEAVDEGTLAQVLIPEGSQDVAVNAPIAVLLEEGESEDGIGAFVESLGADGGASNDVGAPEAPAQESTSEEAPPVAAAGGSAGSAAIVQDVKVSPLARKMASDRGIALGDVPGTGPYGRVIKRDILAFKPSAASSANQAPPASNLQQGQADEVFSGYEPPFTLQPISTMRQVIAQRLQQSKQFAPHFYVSMDVQVDALLALRQRLLETAEQKFSVNDFVLKATAKALKGSAACNSAWGPDGIRQYAQVDLAVAVSIPDGLVTPVIRDATSLNLAQLSGQVKELAGKARDGKLKPQEFQGGTFTVSNMGMFGVTSFSAILNPPQAGILAVGAAREVTFADGRHLKTKKVMTLTLSVDHRLVDGVEAAKFLGQIKAFLEEPGLMLAA